MYLCRLEPLPELRRAAVAACSRAGLTRAAWLQPNSSAVGLATKEGRPAPPSHVAGLLDGGRARCDARHDLDHLRVAGIGHHVHLGAGEAAVGTTRCRAVQRYIIQMLQRTLCCGRARTRPSRRTAVGGRWEVAAPSACTHMQTRDRGPMRRMLLYAPQLCVCRCDPDASIWVHAQLQRFPRTPALARLPGG